MEEIIVVNTNRIMTYITLFLHFSKLIYINILGTNIITNGKDNIISYILKYICHNWLFRYFLDYVKSYHKHLYLKIKLGMYYTLPRNIKNIQQWKVYIILKYIEIIINS